MRHNMIIERIIGTLPIQTKKDPLVKVGICNRLPLDLLQKNEFYQCVRIGDEPIRMLTRFAQKDDELHYQFEDSLLRIQKHNNLLYYTVKTPTLQTTHEMSQIHQRLYKPISMQDSKELDVLATFLKNGV